MTISSDTAELPGSSCPDGDPPRNLSFGFLKIGEASEVGEHHRCRGPSAHRVPTPSIGVLGRAGRTLPTHRQVGRGAHSDTNRTASGARDETTSGAGVETGTAAGHGAHNHAASSSGDGSSNRGTGRTIDTAARNDAPAFARLAGRA